MADVKFEVTRFALSTAAAGNTQDITISGDWTPKAAIFMWGLGSTDDTAAPAGRFGIGFTDGTNENAVDIDAADGGSTSSTERGQRTDCVINLTNAGASVVRFSFNSWINTGGVCGVKLDIDDATGTGYLVTCILIGGSDVSNAFVSHLDDLGTGTSAVDVDFGVGNRFQPDLVFITTTGDATAAPAHSNEAILSFGVGHNDGSDTQRVSIISAVNGAGTATTNTYIGNTAITGQVFNNTVNWLGAIGAYDANGFSITPSASASSDIIFYLALKFTNSPDISLFDMEWPTTGNYAETAPGFQPSFGLISTIQGNAGRNALSQTYPTAVSAVSVFDSSSIYTLNTQIQDGVTTMRADSMSSDRLVVWVPDVTENVVASSYAFDSSGWDFTLSTNPASAVLGWGLAIGAGGAAATNPKGPLGHPLHGPFGGPV